jgi:hypothetical protein
LPSDRGRNSQGEEKKRMGVSPSVFVSPVCLPSDRGRNSQGEEKKRMGVSPSVFVSPVCLPFALTRERRKSRLICAALQNSKGFLRGKGLLIKKSEQFSNVDFYEWLLLFLGYAFLSS